MTENHVHFVLSKGPADDGGGDSRLADVIVKTMSRLTSTRCTHLTSKPMSPWDVEKPTLNLPAVFARSLKTRQSPLFSRFDISNLQVILEQSQSLRFWFDHSYLTSPLRKSPDVLARSIVNMNVLESEVLLASNALWKRCLASWTFRDELLAARRSHATVTYSDGDAKKLSQSGVSALALQMILPVKRIIRQPKPVALFIGDQRWEPNRQAVAEALALWRESMELRRHVRLLVVGHPPTRPYKRVPDGVTIKGYVASLLPVLEHASCLVAPVTVGGGVRVKLLESAAWGIPVVASEAAVGSISQYLPMEVVQMAQMPDHILAFALNPKQSLSQGSLLQDSLDRLWSEGFLESQLESILKS